MMQHDKDMIDIIIKARKAMDAQPIPMHNRMIWPEQLSRSMESQLKEMIAVGIARKIDKELMAYDTAQETPDDAA